MTEAGIALQTYQHKPEIEMDGDSLQEGIAVLTRRLMEHESPCGEHGGGDRHRRTGEWGARGPSGRRFCGG